MSTNPNNPLTFQHLSDINLALKAIDAALSQAQLAQQAGIDVTSETQQLQAQQKQLLQIKATYFPGQ